MPCFDRLSFGYATLSHILHKSEWKIAQFQAPSEIQDPVLFVNASLESGDAEWVYWLIWTGQK